MTQPPDDLERRPDGSGPADAVAPEDQPTIAWTPPPAPGEVAPSDVPPGDLLADDLPPGEVPRSDLPPGEIPLTEWTPTQPAPLDVPAPTPPESTPTEMPPAQPPFLDATSPPLAASGDVPVTPVTPPPSPSPIISASPSVPTDAAGPGLGPAPAAPLVGWETPAPAGAAPGREGYVIAGMGARLVAYFLDGLIVSIIPTILTLLVVDYSGLIQQSIDAARSGATAGQTTFTISVTPELILVTLISLALQYLYFVGFWTSGGRATLGMRGLKIQVVDAATGATLSLSAATKRFIALGSPLALLILVPTLQSAAGIAQFALSLFLFFTAITNDRRQGLHDKWANSLVIRSSTSGDGAVVVGCLLLITIVVGFAIILFGTVLAAMGPYLEELIREAEQTT